jgi:hypothetical protein
VESIIVREAVAAASPQTVPGDGATNKAYQAARDAVIEVTSLATGNQFLAHKCWNILTSIFFFV